MAWIVVVALSASLLSVGLFHAVAAVLFARTMRQQATNKPLPSFQPKAAVIMSVRGWDPSLEAGLRGLLAQEYDPMQILVVVDNPGESTLAMIEQLKSDADLNNRLALIVLEQRLETCGLKCSAILQAVQHLDRDVEVLVLMDSDVTPSRDWLRKLVAPLADATNGLVTTNQWFEPQRATFASLVRSVWNAGALVPTALLAHPWGGSCAMRWRDVQRARLLDIWKRSIVDDGPLTEAMQKLDLKIVFLPQLININREQCTWAFVSSYVPRMLLWSRMFEPTFYLTFLHMLLAVGSVLGGIVGVVWMVALQQWLTAAVLAGVLVTFWISMLFGYCTVRSAVARAVESSSISLAPLSGRRLLLISFATLVCKLSYGMWTLRATLARRVQWRQATYDILGPHTIKLVHYQPLLSDGDGASEVSL